MPNKRKVLPSPDTGFVEGIANHLKLVWALMKDQRINSLLKLLPIGSLVYLISPIDVPGPLDDFAVVWASTYVFIELCPPDVVDELRAEINRTIPGTWAESDSPDLEDEDIIDAEYEDN